MSLYSVAQLSEETGLTAHTLRYYEKETLLLGVSRDASGRRQYSHDHLLALRFISALRATDMPIRTIKKYIQLYREGEHTGVERMQLLQDHEQSVIRQLDQTKASLKLIRNKIKMYSEKLESDSAH